MGEDKETAFYTMFHGTAHVVLGSGLTIAGATFCLSFTRLPYFQTLGVPLAIGMFVVMLAGVVLMVAIISVVTRFGKLLEPKRAMRIRGWRKVGAAVVRWPGPILVATIALALVGLLALPGYKTNYNDRDYLPADLPAGVLLRNGPNPQPGHECGSFLDGDGMVHAITIPPQAEGGGGDDAYVPSYSRTWVRAAGFAKEEAKRRRGTPHGNFEINS